MISRGIVPNLVISQKVMDKIATTARQFIADETGESMVGFVLQHDEPEHMPTIYVLDTISPDEEETLRRTHTFQQGDDLQDEIIWWLQENWRLCREKGFDSDQAPLQPQWNVPLRYLGDWHKQPGYMIQPSGGDLLTALSWLDDEENQMEYLLVPIVTLGHPATTYEDDNAQVNYCTVNMPDGSNLRVDWWYIHRDVRVFQPITPVIMPESTFPRLTPYPWHLLYPQRMEDEVEAISEQGMYVQALVWQADQDIPMELCFFVARPGSPVLLLATEHDFPATAPRAYVAPFAQFDPNADFYDIFAQFWATARPIGELLGWVWSSERSLKDYVHAIEAHFGIAPLPTSSRVVNIEVQFEDDDEQPQAETDTDGASGANNTGKANPQDVAQKEEETP